MKFKNSYKSTQRWIFALLMYYIFAVPITSNAQSILNVGIGAGLQEGYNVSIRYQAEQTQYALGIGTLKGEFEKRVSVSASMYYHFDGISTLTSRRLWYGKVNIIYYNYDYEFSSFDINSFSFGISVGRDFNITKRLGINSDVGFNLGNFENADIPFIGAGIWLFYRL
jgi:hypothetical protein